MTETFEEKYPMFKFLYEDGFEVIDPGFHGRRIVYLVSDKFNIKITLGRRAGIYLFLAPLQKEKELAELKYLVLEAYLSYLLKDMDFKLPITVEHSTEDQLEIVAHFLKENCAELCAFLETTNYAKHKNEFEAFLNKRWDYSIEKYNKEFEVAKKKRKKLK